MTPPIPQGMLDLLRRCGHGVLATCGPDGPLASLMGLALEPGGRALYLVTGRGTRKFGNLTSDPRAALLLDDRDAAPRLGPGRVRALTVFGRVRILDGGEAQAASAALAARHPHLAPLLDAPDTALLVLRIERLQLLDGPRDAAFWP